MTPTNTRAFFSIVSGSFLGLTQVALPAAPTADYRFVPVQPTPIAQLVLIATPQSQADIVAMAPRAIRDVATPFDRLVGTSLTAGDALRFHPLSIRAVAPSGAAHPPAFSFPVLRTN